MTEANVRVFTGAKPFELTGAIAKVVSPPSSTPDPKRKGTLERHQVVQEGPISKKINFINILKEKAARSIEIQNKFQVLTDTESESKEQGTNS